MDPSTVTIIAIAIAVLIPLVWFIATYNAFIRIRNHPVPIMYASSHHRIAFDDQCKKPVTCWDAKI